MKSRKMDRQYFIQEFYDTCPFPHCARNKYSCAYFGLAHALEMNDVDFKKFFPMFTDPSCTSEWRCNELSMYILENCSIDVLEIIVETI